MRKSNAKWLDGYFVNAWANAKGPGFYSESEDRFLKAMFSAIAIFVGGAFSAGVGEYFNSLVAFWLSFAFITSVVLFGGKTLHSFSAFKGLGSQQRMAYLAYTDLPTELRKQLPKDMREVIAGATDNECRALSSQMRTLELNYMRREEAKLAKETRATDVIASIEDLSSDLALQAKTYREFM